MALSCPACGREYEIFSDPGGLRVRCGCGEEVSPLPPGEAQPDLEREKRGEGVAGAPLVAQGACRRSEGGGGSSPPPDKLREHMEEIARGADRIASLILFGDLPDVDISIEIERLRERAEELFPGKGWLFEILYEARFRRLREQWGRRGEVE